MDLKGALLSDLEDIRGDYADTPFDEEHAGDDPIALLGRWLDEAIAANQGPWYEPNAMALATATPNGAPSCRIVLLKQLDERGLTFFTFATSRKGREMNANPVAAATFHWASAQRQVRVEGPVETLDRAAVADYFRRRPRRSQLAAAASRQSEVILDRAELERRFAETARRVGDGDVPLPAEWAGYRIVPLAIEFWQGRPDRMHDRIRFRRDSIGQPWTRERLSP